MIPWGAFADDQLGLMDHLGIRQFFFMGYCIGGPFAMKLMERAPQRMVAAVLCQPVGHRPENPDLYVQLRQECLGQGVSRAARLTCRWRPSRNTCTTSTACGPTSCTACRAILRARARRQCLSCRTTLPAHPLQTSYRHSFALPECRDHGVSLEGPPGTEGPDHQPGAHLPEGASNGVGAPARLTGLSVCVGSSP